MAKPDGNIPTLSDVTARVKRRETAYLAAKDALEAERLDFGKHARVVREQYHVTLTEMAKRLGVTKAFLSDFERGRRWSSTVAAKLHQALR